MPHQVEIARKVVNDLRAQGITVLLEPGWEGRGSSTFSPRGLVVHHTAGAATGDYPSLRIVRDGRPPKIPGPLAQWGLGRQTVRLIACGRANHAGRGGWRGLSGNTSVWGIEGESTGRGDWTPFQRFAYPRMAAALAYHTRFPVEMICAHREWAPSRKPDPVGIDMPSFRAEVARLLSGRVAVQSVTPAPVQEEDMIPIDVQPGKEQVIWLEPTAPNGTGFLGTKAGLIVVTTHRPTHKVQIAAPAVGLGWDEITITNERPFVHKLERSAAGRLVVRNRDQNHAIGGQVMYRR